MIRTIAILVLLAATAADAQLTTTVKRIRLEHATSAELAGTTLDLGHAVFNEENPADLRIGDGATPGGIRVGSDWWTNNMLTAWGGLSRVDVEALLALSIGKFQERDAAALAAVAAVSGRVDTVEGWGDHAEAGYLTEEADAAALGAIGSATSALLDLAGTRAMTGDLNMGNQGINNATYISSTGGYAPSNLVIQAGSAGPDGPYHVNGGNLLLFGGTPRGTGTMGRVIIQGKFDATNITSSTNLVITTTYASDIRLGPEYGIEKGAGIPGKSLYLFASDAGPVATAGSVVITAGSSGESGTDGAIELVGGVSMTEDLNMGGNDVTNAKSFRTLKGMMVDLDDEGVELRSVDTNVVELTGVWAGSTGWPQFDGEYTWDGTDYVGPHYSKVRSTTVGGTPAWITIWEDLQTEYGPICYAADFPAGPWRDPEDSYNPVSGTAGYGGGHVYVRHGSIGFGGANAFNYVLGTNVWQGRVNDTEASRISLLPIPATATNSYIRPDGGTNTVSFDESGNMIIAVDGTAAMTISPAGDVGVGTTPSASFSLRTDSSFYAGGQVRAGSYLMAGNGQVFLNSAGTSWLQLDGTNIQFRATNGVTGRIQMIYE